METKTNSNDGLKEIKESFSNQTVKINLINALQDIKVICQQRDYVVEGSIDKIIMDINLDNSTLSSRKKLARKIYYFMKKKTIRTMGALLSFIRKRFMTDENKIVIKPSTLEQEITIAREKYRSLQKEVEAARVIYREKKKLFHAKYV